MNIQLSGRINAEDGMREFLRNFAPFLADKSDVESLTIDLTGATFIYPSALLYILGLKDICNDNDVELNLNITEGSAIHDYLVFCGASTYFNLPPFPLGMPRHIDATQLGFKLYYENKITNTGRMAEELYDYLNKDGLLKKFDEAQIISGIDEILRNIDQHSGYSRFMLLAQTFPKSNRLRIVAFDNGIGIRKHITKLPYEQTHPLFRDMVSSELYEKMKSNSAKTAIKYAAIEAISGTDYKINSGAGLNYVIKDVCRENGRVTILSEDGCVTWVNGGEPKGVKMPVVTTGTMLCMTVTCN